MTPAMTTVRVESAAPYDVVIGRDLIGRLPALVGDRAERVALLYDQSLAEQAQRLVEVLTDHYDLLALGLPAGEAAKSATVVNDCWEALGEQGFTRSDAVVTIGGGATTDVGGFVAATWLRGVRVVHVPSSLLAMVDAAVGGKTGIDTGRGKNLVGAFHEPAGVLCDLDLLATLPSAEFVSGLGEVLKCGFIADPAILALVEGADDAAEGAGVLTADSPQVPELVERAVRVKAEIVAGDLRETGGRDGSGGHPGREALNYGHTLAHAIETHSGYRVRHGEAVAIGCVYAAELAHRAGLIDADLVERHRTVLARAGLPIAYGEASFDDLIDTMRVDKKARGSVLRFLVLRGLADPVILAGPAEEDLRAAFDAMAGTQAGAEPDAVVGNGAGADADTHADDTAQEEPS